MKQSKSCWLSAISDLMDSEMAMFTLIKFIKLKICPYMNM